ncbi:MAG: hypothetical protein ACE5L6_05475 [Candidatus Bathyarchaeia archaeon]
MSVASERNWKRLAFRWTAREGAVAIILFFGLTILIQYITVYLFRSHGLTDTQTFQLSLATFTITISPLFHLIPLGVIAVLTSSWTYLTRYIARVPHGKPPAKKPPAKQRKPIKRVKKKRFKWFRNLSRRLSRTLKTFHYRVKAGILRIHGVSPVMQRLFFARAAIKGTATIILVFLVSFLILNLMGYPSLIHDLVVDLYRTNQSFHGFVMRTIEIADSIGRTLSPIGLLASAINGTLTSASPSFRGALEGFVTSTTAPMAEQDLTWKYIIYQNIAAWISAIVALTYGQYTSRLFRRHRR